MNGVKFCCHISRVGLNRIWVSDEDNLILKNTTGDTLHHIPDILKEKTSGFQGLHTVNIDDDLIYINVDYNIIKLSKDMNTVSFIVRTTDSSWKPSCVYSSPYTGDLLVGMKKYDPRTSKIMRYKKNGQLVQTIQCNDEGHDLYGTPQYIVENDNGDVVVTDRFSAVVVTNVEGRHLFTYTGHPPGSGLDPYGLCTDELSHIFICDGYASKIHIIDKYGQFVSHLLTNNHGIIRPCSLSYDVKTHLLWVGSFYDYTISVFEHMAPINTLAGK